MSFSVRCHLELCHLVFVELCHLVFVRIVISFSVRFELCHFSVRYELSFSVHLVLELLCSVRIVI